jgi:hypothetical protein
MTGPPYAPPPPDPTSDPPPFSTPQAPPYPPYGGEYPTYQLGSAPVTPTSAYPPVTGVPGYAVGTGRRSRGVVIGVIAAAAALLLCGVCGGAGFLLARGDNGGKQSGASTPVPAAPAPSSAAQPGAAHTVVYEVTGGSGSAIVAYAVNAGASPDEVGLPWRKEVTVDRGSFLVTVFAVRFEGGPLTCRVLVDGREVTRNTSDNAVTCTHLVVD